MSWSLLVGRLWGTEIRLHTSLLLLIPYVLYMFKPADVPGALRVLLLITAIFVCVLLHELGHTLAARLLGVDVKSVLLWPLGGFANLSHRPERVSHNLIITAAGPVTNLALSIGLAGILMVERLVYYNQLAPRLSLWLGEMQVFPFLVGLLAANLGLAVFNLIPIYPLDGGQIARDVLKLLLGEKKADLLLLIISLPLAIGLTMLGFYTLDIIIILTGLLLALASLSLNLNLSQRINQGLLYLFDRGSYYLRGGDYDQAVTAFSQAIRRRPNQTGLYLNRALAYQNLMAFASAWQDVNRALQIDPESFLAWTLKGEISETGRKDLDQALLCYNRAVQLNPDWPLAYADRAGVYQKQGQLDLAASDLERAVILNQGMVVVYLLRSILRYQMGNLTGAHADSEKALRFAPNWMLTFQEVFLTNLAGHLNWALDYYQRAEQRLPGAYQVYQGRADALRINHQYEAALINYQRAIQLAPQQAELYLRRGKAYLGHGMQSLAADDFQQAIHLANFSHQQRQAQAELFDLNQAAADGLAKNATPSESTVP
jgi:tetratricopeptide (TPR) repeat protein